MKLYYYGLSDPGCIRSNNEDYIYTGTLARGDSLFVVADGMGGHHAGEVASRMAVTRLVGKLENCVRKIDSSVLNEMIQEINREIFDRNNQGDSSKRMGTTLTSLIVTDDQAYIAHVGDSRVYRYRNTTDQNNQPLPLTQLTQDHSFVATLVKNGILNEEEARKHPKRNVLNQSLGMRKNVTSQVLGPLPIRSGDKYLLCSDGLSSVLQHREIQDFTGMSSSREIVKKLVNRAKTRGGPDNISVVVIDTVFRPETWIPENETKPEIYLNNMAKPHGERKKRGVKILLLALLLFLLATILYLVIHSTELGQNTLHPGATEATENIHEQS